MDFCFFFFFYAILSHFTEAAAAPGQKRLKTGAGDYNKSYVYDSPLLAPQFAYRPGGGGWFIEFIAIDLLRTQNTRLRWLSRPSTPAIIERINRIIVTFYDYNGNIISSTVAVHRRPSRRCGQPHFNVSTINSVMFRRRIVFKRIRSTNCVQLLIMCKKKKTK